MKNKVFTMSSLRILSVIPFMIIGVIVYWFSMGISLIVQGARNAWDQVHNDLDSL